MGKTDKPLCGIGGWFDWFDFFLILKTFIVNKFFLLIFPIITQLYGAQKTIRTNFTVSAPMIDGHISPLEWNVSDSASHFIQLEPAKGLPASESTVVYILYNEKYIFFAFKCFDRQPGTIVSNIRQRDKIVKSDDAVFVILDTHLDQRSGFIFEVNPAGTQSDLRIADDGRQSDINWDTQWLAAARRTPWGWSAEIAIPFSGISFDENLETWGKNYDRDFRLIEGKVATRLLDNLAILYEFNKLDYEPDPEDNSTMINILTLDYNFSRDLWVRVLAQNNIGEDALYFYGLFGWRFQPPFGALYLIYTADQTENLTPYALEKNKIFFLKFSYQF
jgi:hypothetical protein